jgi:arginase
MTGKALSAMNRIALIGSASGLGASNHATEKGPDYLKQNGLTEMLQDHHFDTYWSEILRPMTIDQGETVLPQLVPQLEQLSKIVRDTIFAHEFPVVIGGDHAMAVGNISGVVEAYNAQQNFGLIWVDAHMDAHTPQTSHSHNYHGMPVAALLGFGDPKLTDLIFPGPKIKPEHLVLIGPRSFEREEEQLLKDLRVKIFYGEDVAKRGMQSIFQEAIAIVNKDTQGFGVSIDLDAFDPTEAPGVGTPSPHGIQVNDFLPFVRSIREHPQFKFLEIAEFNPDLDRDRKTEKIIQNLLLQLLPRMK